MDHWARGDPLIHTCYDETHKQISMSRQIQHLSRAHSQSSSADVRRVSSTGDLLGRSGGDLRALMLEIGEPAYRGAQLYHALYAERRLDFASMSNLPTALRQRLANDFR